MPKVFYKKSYRTRKKRSILRNRSFRLGILFFILISGIYYFLFFSEFFQIKEIRVSGNQRILSGDIKNIVLNQLEQRMVFFYSQSIFAANFKEIKNALLKEFPQIDKIRLKRILPNNLAVVVEERDSVAVFNHNERLFYIDRKGIIFEEIEQDKTEALIIKSLILEKNLKTGIRAVNDKTMFQILKINSKLNEDLKIPILKAVVVSERRLNVKTVETWQIYFNLEDVISSQILNLDLILNEIISSEDRRVLEYIDLRFGNRVFFK